MCRRRFIPLAVLGCAIAASGAAHAERATEVFAPTQISVARDLLDHARAAESAHDYAQASAYAQEAQVDARLAWGMTDSTALHAEAAQIAGQAAALAAAAGYSAPNSGGGRFRSM
jgi:hypothetical protein